MKRSIILFVLLFVTFYNSNLFAHDNRLVHRKISEKAELASITLENYLDQNPDFNGINTQFLGKSILNWLKDGSTIEDEPMCRAVNHFHNPLLLWNESAMSDSSWLVNAYCGSWTPYFSNITWATGFLSAPPNGQKAIFPTNPERVPNTWDRARFYYYVALSADSKDIRDQYFAATFQSLGQVLHLLQDVSVPAHVRNDFSSHATFTGFCDALGCYPLWQLLKWYHNPFENYVLTHDDLIDDAAAVSSPPLFQNPRLTDFWDSGQYYITQTPSNSPSQGLAEYTSANYFSDETIPNNIPSLEHIFPFPVLDQNNYQICEGLDDTGTYMRKYISRGACSPTVDHFAAVSLTNKEQLITPNNIATLALELDDNVHNTYATELLPRAIGYSAELLNYFFRGEVEVKDMPVFDDRNENLQKLYVKVRNTTPTQETMYGDSNSSCFMLSWHYTPSGGSDDIWGKYPYCVYLKNDLPYGKYANGNDIDDEAHETTIIFENLDQLQNVAPILKTDYLLVEFTLTYVGSLGDERMLPSNTPDQVIISGAVIGKQFQPAGSILFDEEWLTSPKGDNSWYMSHDSSGNNTDTTFCNDADSTGTATTGIDPGNSGGLMMNNTRYAVPNCDPSLDMSPGHCNVSLIGNNATSGNTYNPTNSAGNYIFPINITNNTYIQFSLDAMSISPTPPASNYAQAYQVLEFQFNHGYVLQFSLNNQSIQNYNPYVGYFSFDPGYTIVGNIYELFAEWGYPIPPSDLQLNQINISQQTLWNLPCNTQYTQSMAVDLIRVGELKATD